VKSQAYALLAFAAIAAAVGAGCAKSSDQSTTTTTSSGAGPSTTSATSAPNAAATQAVTTGAGSNGSNAQGDPTAGHAVFTANCSSCHGATGHEGGVGPSLSNEKSRKNYDQTVAWIKNPQPPMPKLYPSPLSEKDVDNVAAYVQTL